MILLKFTKVAMQFFSATKTMQSWY